MWHSSVSKQISRERHLISTTEELQTQLQAIIVEKLDTEKGFKELLMRVIYILLTYQNFSLLVVLVELYFVLKLPYISVSAGITVVGLQSPVYLISSSSRMQVCVFFSTLQLS